VFTDRVELTTPERVVVTHDLAGVGSRLLAQLVDAVVIVLVETTLILGVITIDVASTVVAITVLIILGAAIPLGYYIVLEGRTGQTIGKRALRVRVVTDDGAPIGWRESLIRNLLRLIDFLPALYVVGGVTAMLSKRWKRLGDHAAGTIAVRIPGDADRVALVSSAPTFVEAVATSTPYEVPQGYATVAPELLAVISEYRRRYERLDPQWRERLSRGIAEHLEPVHARPLGMGTEEFALRAAATYVENGGWAPLPSDFAPAVVAPARQPVYSAAAYPTLPPALVAALAAYGRDHRGMSEADRMREAGRLAAELQPYHPRPAGMSIEEFVERAAVTYAGGGA
jgi:uncharacterized RDD family membrane protein YckC